MTNLPVLASADYGSKMIPLKSKHHFATANKRHQNFSISYQRNVPPVAPTPTSYADIPVFTISSSVKKLGRIRTF